MELFSRHDGAALADRARAIRDYALIGPDGHGWRYADLGRRVSVADLPGPWVAWGVPSEDDLPDGVTHVLAVAVGGELLVRAWGFTAVPTGQAWPAVGPGRSVGTAEIVAALGATLGLRVAPEIAVAQLDGATGPDALPLIAVLPETDMPDPPRAALFVRADPTWVRALVRRAGGGRLLGSGSGQAVLLPDADAATWDAVAGAVRAEGRRGDATLHVYRSERGAQVWLSGPGGPGAGAIWELDWTQLDDGDPGPPAIDTFTRLLGPPRDPVAAAALFEDPRHPDPIPALADQWGLGPGLVAAVAGDTAGAEEIRVGPTSAARAERLALEDHTDAGRRAARVAGWVLLVLGLVLALLMILGGEGWQIAAGIALGGIAATGGVRLIRQGTRAP